MKILRSSAAYALYDIKGIKKFWKS